MVATSAIYHTWDGCVVEKRVTEEGDSRHRMGLGACQWSRRSLGYARLEVPGKA